MTTRNLMVRLAALGVATIALASCDSQVSPKDERAFAGPSKKSNVAPTRTGYADVNGGRFYYQIYGDLNSQPSPLLVLHGSYMSSDAMAPLIGPLTSIRLPIGGDG